MTNRTQQAAQKCADLANAIGGNLSGAKWTAADFTNPELVSREASRREIERIDARDREVLALLEKMSEITDDSALLAAKAEALLRADLLPDPKPTLLEEFCAAHELQLEQSDARLVKKALDWIAKRGLDVKPTGETK